MEIKIPARLNVASGLTLKRNFETREHNDRTRPFVR
jgi:hypothetical protein